MKALIIILGLLSLATLDNAQNKKDTVAIQSTLVRFFDGIAQLNDDAIRKEVTPDFLLIEDGKVSPVDSLLRLLAPLKSRGIERVNKLDIFTTGQQGSTAWVGYHNQATLSFNGQQRRVYWLESAVLIRDKGVWKIKLLHSTKLDKLL